MSAPTSRSTSGRADRRARPPMVPTTCLRLSLPEGPLRESILGDFSEEHHRRASAGSAAHARLWYWRNALDLAGRSAIGRLLTRDRYWAGTRAKTSRGPASRGESRTGGDGTGPGGRGSGGDSGGWFGPRRLLDTVSQDLRFAGRQIARRPGFSILVALTLAVGIGANVAIFSVLKGVVLRELPYPHPEQLVAVWESPEEASWYQPFSSPDFYDVRAQAETLEGFGVASGRWFNLSTEGNPVRVLGGICTPSLLRLLGVPPLHGRLFTDDEETEGNERVLLLSYGLWQRQFGGSPSVVGTSILADGQPYEIVGVMPEDFEFPTPWGGRDDSELWSPFVLPLEDSARSSHWLGAIGRLADGVTVDELTAELEGIALQLAAAYPDTNARTRMWVEPMIHRTLGGISSALVFLLVVVGLVLLIACANVASMLLARGSHRLPELAIRASMGAGRRRLMGQLLTESLLLSVLGGGIGIAVAYQGVGALRTILPENVPRVDGIQVDVQVLAFAALVTIATGMLFGLAPAMFAARTDLVTVLKEGRAGRGSSRGRNRFLAGLVVAQVALGFVLVNAAALLYLSYSNVVSQEMNFDTEGVLAAGITLVGPAYEEPHQRRAFTESLIERVRGLPTVLNAGITNKLPLRGGSNGEVLVEDEVFDPEVSHTLVEHSFVDDGYHHAIGIDVIAGRTLTQEDLNAAAVAAGEDISPVELPLVINRAMAETLWPEEGPLGKLVRPNSSEEGYRARVVGVVENTRQWGAEREPLPEMYFPYSAEVWGRLRPVLVVRTSGDPSTLVPAIRSVIREIDDQIPLAEPRTMADVLHESTGQRRFSMLLVGLFAGTALLLIVAGTYGMMSCAVSQRTHEIGVRVALGANNGRVFRLFLRRAAYLFAPGLGFGLLGALGASALTRNMVYGISALSPLVLVAAAAAMCVVAFAAITGAGAAGDARGPGAGAPDGVGRAVGRGHTARRDASGQSPGRPGRSRAQGLITREERPWRPPGWTAAPGPSINGPDSQLRVRGLE